MIVIDKTLEDQKLLQKLETRTTTLIEVLESASLPSSILQKSIREIGELIHNISWQEDNPNCIRNKHGYRNRYKKKKGDKTQKGDNEKNIEGAKINFELLEHLEEHAGKKMFYLNQQDLKENLVNLKAKISFILENKAPSQGHLLLYRDEGFLLRVVAYYRDQKCIDKLIDLLNKIDSEEYRSLDLSNIVHRHWLGNFFVQFGETAKSISDFIRTEEYFKPEENIIRFLFGKLGHYRQNIKLHPKIVQKEDTQKLLEIKNKLELNCQELKQFLEKVRDFLEKKFSTSKEVKHYEGIAALIKKDCHATLKKLTDSLTLGSFKEKSSLSEEIHAKQQEIEQLQRDISKFKSQQEELNTSSLNAPSQDNNSELSSFLSTKLGEKTRNILNLYLRVYIDKGNTTLKSFKENILDKVDEEPSEQVRGRLKVLDKLLKVTPPSSTNRIELKKHEKKKADIELAEKILSSADIRIEELCKEHEELSYETQEERSLRYKTLEGKISAKEEEIKRHKEELGRLIEKQQDKSIKLAKKVSSEIKVLIEMEEGSQYADDAQKMGVGFLRQYYKDLLYSKDSSKAQELLKNDHLFQRAMWSVIEVGNKFVMHQALTDQNIAAQKVKETISKHVLTSDISVGSTIVSLCYEEGQIKEMENILADVYPTGFFTRYEESGKELYAILTVIYGKIRLKDLLGAERVFCSNKLKLDTLIDNLSINSKPAFLIYQRYIDSLIYLKRFSEAEELLSYCLNKIGDNEEFQEHKLWFQEHLLLLSHEYVHQLDEEEFRDTAPIGLLISLAKRYLEGGQVDEAGKVLASVGQREFPHTQQGITDRIGFHTTSVAYYQNLLDSMSVISKEQEKNALYIYFHQEPHLLSMDSIFSNYHSNIIRGEIEVDYHYHAVILRKLADVQLVIYRSYMRLNKSGIAKKSLDKCLSTYDKAFAVYQELDNQAYQQQVAKLHMDRAKAYLFLEGRLSPKAKSDLLFAKEILATLQIFSQKANMLRKLAHAFQFIKELEDSKECLYMLQEDQLIGEVQDIDSI